MSSIVMRCLRKNCQRRGQQGQEKSGTGRKRHGDYLIRNRPRTCLRLLRANHGLRTRLHVSQKSGAACKASPTAATFFRRQLDGRHRRNQVLRGIRLSLCGAEQWEPWACPYACSTVMPAPPARQSTATSGFATAPTASAITGNESRQGLYPYVLLAFANCMRFPIASYPASVAIHAALLPVRTLAAPADCSPRNGAQGLDPLRTAEVVSPLFFAIRSGWL